MQYKFKNKKYELLFENRLPPLEALNFCDELFFNEFEKLCGERYRILSVIQNNFQRKYIPESDLNELKKQFRRKISEKRWGEKILKKYEKFRKELIYELLSSSKKRYRNKDAVELITDFKKIRKTASPLDAMSNMLNLFSSQIGIDFYNHLKKYSNKEEILNKNYIYYTQPVKNSRWSKISVKNLADKITLSNIDKNFSKILRIANYIKDDVSELLDLRKKLTRGLFKEISNRLKCSYKDLMCLQISEIEIFLHKKNIDNYLIADRKRITVLFYPKKLLNIYGGKEALNFISKGRMREIKIRERKGNTLSGQPASSGRAKGIAVLAFSGAEANRRMKQGNILITAFTSVEYLPAMKKAAAIITDEGGLTCHAAITSREFNIPCIVGLKVATKVFSDGDIIEVDASKGLVKKMNQ